MFGMIKPLLFKLEAERAHDLTIAALKRLPALRPEPDPASLATSVCGLSFPNPIGLAAGFDKNAEVFRQMLGFGFGFVEVGTLTPRPQPGNDKPRLFRLVDDEAVINRLGFNNQGHRPAYQRLVRYGARRIRVGINVGANKDSADRIADYAAGISAFQDIARYFTINISSPNTPGLRDLQTRSSLEKLVLACQQARGNATTPLFVKIAPDLTNADLSDIAVVALDLGIDGLIVSNTTISRPDGLASSLAAESGGLSGRPLMALSTDRLKFVYAATRGQVPLIGVGGIASGDDAYAKLRAGASLVQLYSALVYQGPGLVGRIKRELAQLLVRDGMSSVVEAVGRDC
jgi:dihydroorotate dehydrogenase